VDARTVEPTGSSGLGGSQTAQVGIKDVPPSSLVEGAAADSGDENPALQSPLVINAIAQEWLWRYEYPGHEPSQPLFAYSELVVPVDTTVILHVTSTDVLHSWWVPSLGGQVQATPGAVAQTWFKADAVGRYPGNSTVFSGSAYPAMRSWVRVVTVPEYEDYIERLGSEIREAQGIVQESQEEQTTPTAPSGSDTGGESG
jgi:cytochrome c oxidase subunit 2